MIELSIDEKNFIREIVILSNNTQNVFLGNLLDKYLKDTDVRFDYEYHKVFYCFDKQVFGYEDAVIEHARNLSWTFMRFIKLLKYFEEINYLYLYIESDKSNPKRFGQLIETDIGPICFEIYDPNVKNLLIEYSFKTIVIGQSLIDYVHDNFRSKEQLRHEENMRISKQNLVTANESLEQSKKTANQSKRAIMISIILGLISICTSFYIADKQSKSVTKIENSQFNSLNKGIMLIDSVLEHNIIHDTLNVRIANQTKTINSGK